jgi:hypothetical protein
MNFQFSTEGLNIASSDDPVNINLDNTGLKVYNYSTLTLVSSDKGTGTNKLIITGTAQIGYLQFVKNEKNGRKCTTIYHLDSLIEDIDDLVGDS